MHNEQGCPLMAIYLWQLISNIAALSMHMQTLPNKCGTCTDLYYINPDTVLPIPSCMFIMSPPLIYLQKWWQVL